MYSSTCTLQREEKEKKEHGKVSHIFRKGNGSEPQDLDPGIITGNIESQVVENLFEGLTTPDLHTGLPSPGVAESWKPNADATVFTFYLRKNAVWSNNDPVTAHDFVYAWRRVLNPKLAAEYAYILFYIKNAQAFNSGKLNDPEMIGVKALDDYTLQVQLEGPTPFFDQLTYFFTYDPVHKKTVEKYGRNWTKPENIVTNGAFLLDRWLHQERIVLKKNPTYWDASNVKLTTVELLPIENLDTEQKLFASGELDYTKEVPDIRIPFLRKKPFFRSDPFLTIYMYRLNVTKKPFDNEKVRMALKLAIDRKKITDYIKKAGELPAYSLVPPGIHGYTSPNVLEFDVKKARALLAEAGYPHGKGFPSLEILYNTQLDHQRIALALQDMLRKNLNIEVKLFNQEWKVYLNNVKTLNYDIARGGWIGDYIEPSAFLNIFTSKSGMNQTGWENSEYDELIKEAAATVDTQVRYSLYQKAEELLLEKGPFIPIYFYTRSYLLNPKIKGFLPNLLDMHLLKYVYFEE